MEELGWDRGQDDEELFEFAMHEKQYREYKSGQAKEQFNNDLIERMKKAGKPIPEHLLPKKEEAKADDDMAAVAVALGMYYGKPAPQCQLSTINYQLNDGRRHATEWNRKIYGMNNLM